MAKNITIQTPRFILREFEDADRSSFLVCQTDVEFNKFHTQAELADGHAEAVFDLFLEWKVERPRRNIQLVVSTHSKPSNYLGTVGVRTESRDPTIGEVGIELVPSLWGQGAAREIMKTFLDWTRREMGIHKWIAETAPGNRAAERLAEAAGLIVVNEDGKRFWRNFE